MSDEVKFQIGNAVIVKPREFIPTAFEQQYTALERAGYYGVIGGIQEITGIIKATCYRVDFFGGNLYFIDEDLTLAPPDPRDEELTRLKAENEQLRKTLVPLSDIWREWQLYDKMQHEETTDDGVHHCSTNRFAREMWIQNEAVRLGAKALGRELYEAGGWIEEWFRGLPNE